MTTAEPSPGSDSELTDSLELVRHAQDGEMVAYGELFARYYPRVKALVRKRIGPGLRRGMDSDDLLQEAMLDAIQGFERFEVRSKPELIGWFARIVENSLRTADRHQRAQKRDRAKEVSLQFVTSYMEGSSPNFQPPDDSAGPLQRTSEDEQMGILQQALAGLEPGHRHVIELRHGRGLSWARIAQELDRPSPDAARMLYARARIELQRELARRGGEDGA